MQRRANGMLHPEEHSPSASDGLAGQDVAGRGVRRNPFLSTRHFTSDRYAEGGREMAAAVTLRSGVGPRGRSSL